MIGNSGQIFVMQLVKITCTQGIKFTLLQDVEFEQKASTKTRICIPHVSPHLPPYEYNIDRSIGLSLPECYSYSYIYFTEQFSFDIA